MKQLLIMTVALLVLAITLSILLFFHYLEISYQYRTNLYDISMETYESALKKNFENLNMAMELTALDQVVRDNIFRRDMSNAEMLDVGASMRKVVESNTYLLCPEMEIYSHMFFTYLPGDGRYFFPMSRLKSQIWYEDFIESGQNNFLYYQYNKMTSCYQLTIVHTINNFNTGSLGNTLDDVCYEALTVNVSSMLPSGSAVISETNIDLYLFQDDQLIYSSEEKLNDLAKKSYQVLSDSREENEFLTNNSYAASLFSYEDMGLDVIFLFDTPVQFSALIQNEVGLVLCIGIIAMIVAGLLLLFYLNYHRRIRGVMYGLDSFDESSPKEEVQMPHDDEIDEMYYHIVLMQNRVRTLIEEEYTVKLQMMSAQNEALIACINPHFLYNTLNTISAMASLEGADDTNRMIYHLRDMFQYSSDVARKEVPLQEELKNITDYLSIQEIRYGNTFQYHIDVPKEFLECQVPKLILQPVVENCFKHGFESRPAQNKDALKEIIICAVKEEEKLKIYVTDNGQGMTIEQQAKLMQSLDEGERYRNEKGRTEIGLRNVHQRLKMMYGSECGISVRCEEGNYTCIRITVLFEN